MTNYEVELKSLKKVIKLKGILYSEDNGRTWFVFRQDYVSHAKDEHDRFNFATVNLEGLPLKTLDDYVPEG